MSNWIEVGELEEIPAQGSRVVKTDDFNIAVFFNINGRIVGFLSDYRQVTSFPWTFDVLRCGISNGSMVGGPSFLLFEI